jgi:hypothetical protein
MEIFFAVLWYGVPLAILPFVLRRRHFPRMIGLMAFFVGPFIGELTYLLSLPRHGLQSLLDMGFWRTFVGFYPMAIFPLGLWVVVFILLGSRLLSTIASQYNPQPVALQTMALVLGAVTGGIFMSLFTLSAIATGASNYPNEGLTPYLFAGIATGGVMGIISSYSMGSRREK